MSKSLDDLIEEATVDCYEDSECLAGFEAMLADNLKFPFKAKVVGEEVEVIGIELRSNSLRAVCKRKGERCGVDVLSIKYDSRQVSGSKWIEAYREWAKYR